MNPAALSAQYRAALAELLASLPPKEPTIPPILAMAEGKGKVLGVLGVTFQELSTDEGSSDR
jgi:hypothetical protein